MKKTLKGTLALFFCVATIFATMLMVSAVGAPKVKVKAVAYNSVTLTWSKVSGADGYQVQRSTDGKNWTTLTSSTKEVTYKDSKKLTTGRTYRYRVRAYDGILIKKYSSWSTVSAKPVPGKVTGLKAASRAYNAVKLAWTKVAGASGYVVQSYTGGKWKSLGSTKSNSYVVTKLTLGKTYNFRVLAFRTVSKKKIYGAASSALKTGPALSAPSTFVLTGVSTSAVKISWSAVAGAKGYLVYNGATKKWVNVKTARSLTVKKLKPGTKYSFIVRAYSGSHKGINSATRTFITKPAVPTSIKTASSTSAIKFSWKAVSGATGYQPAIYSSVTKKWTNLSATSKTSVTVKKLTSGTQYLVRVRAYVKNANVKGIDALGYGEWAPAVTTYTVPLAPKSVSLTKVSQTALTISWAKSNGATSYEVYNPVSGSWTSTKATSYQFTGLEAGTKYSFKVKAVVSTKKSAETASYSFITTPAAPANLRNGLTVNGVTVADSTTDSISLTWDSVKGATGYKVQYSADNSNWSVKTTTSSGVTLRDLEENTTYYVRVSAFAKNSNVSGIAAETNSEYSAIEARTLRNDPAIPSIATTSDSSTGVQLTWTASSNAIGYVIEKFDYYSGWMVYDFNTNQWKSLNGYFSQTSIISTTELSFLDIDDAKRSDLYRIRTVFSDGCASVPSAYATGNTADISLEIGADGLVTVEWPKIEGADSYIVTSLYPVIEQYTYSTSELTYDSVKNTYKGKLYLAPESIYSLIIGSSKGYATNYLNFCTGALSTGTSSAAKNSQLLYLARAINNTKFYKDEITVKNHAEISYSIDYLKFGIYVANSAEEVSELFKNLGALVGEDIDFPTKETETIDVQFAFKDGVSITDGHTGAQLKTFIEPASNNAKSAYLYNGVKNNTAWTAGFDSVTATANADGSHTITAKLKKENGSTNYHSGFISSFNMSDFSGDGITMDSFDVGSSTLKAVIDSDGYLKSYIADAPYNASMSADLGMTMRMSGKTAFNYTVTR